jgi:hypothetical protein
MNTCLRGADKVSAPSAVRLNGNRPDVAFAQAGLLPTKTVAELYDFAVGFSRQPLPSGNRFAIANKADGPGTMATDAPTRNRLELTTLRPETIESCPAKLSPTAIFQTPVVANHERHRAVCCPTGRQSQADSTVETVELLEAIGGELPNISTVEEARVGFKKITNGVKQRAPGARLLGVEFVHGKGEGVHVADVRSVPVPSQSP